MSETSTEVLSLTGRDLNRAATSLIQSVWMLRHMSASIFPEVEKLIAEAEETLKKINTIVEHAYLNPSPVFRRVDGSGGEEIVTINRTVVMRTREAARRVSEGGAA